MRTLAKRGAAALMLTCMTGNVMAATQASCAHPNEMAAVKTAAIQQRLMVAALTCHATPSYNKFVVSYQKDLQASDRQLENFFRRLHGKSGTEQYHAFKTRLANESSMASIHDFAGYCDSAQQMFEEAQARPTLASFMADRETAADAVFEPCPVITARNTRPAHKPVKVVPAQGRGLAPQ
ncbi:MAG: hypothetical protein KGO48_18905 [Alphaproteobacteria bacterium]|nr:hypothetical protein [Alphaproteobacteria bacterium]